MNQFSVTPDTTVTPPAQTPAAVAAHTSELMLEIAELRLENERLRAEREVLKKALAIVFAELK
jgi:hypothetical protein